MRYIKARGEKEVAAVAAKVKPNGKGKTSKAAGKRKR